MCRRSSASSHLRGLVSPPGDTDQDCEHWEEEEAGLEELQVVAAVLHRRVGTWSLRPEGPQTGFRLGELGRASEGAGPASASSRPSPGPVRGTYRLVTEG